MIQSQRNKERSYRGKRFYREDVGRECEVLLLLRRATDVLLYTILHLLAECGLVRGRC
jgi:hypothetical protein